MPTADFWIVVRWWGTLFLVGAAAFPLTRRLFTRWYDEGYLFSKAVGMAVAGWLVYALGTAHLAPFTTATILGSLGGVFVLGLFFNKSLKASTSLKWGTILTEELFFFVALVFWSWVKAHEPSIRGLEKFMDYGFMNSILHAKYFPPADMWYPPYPINYYYFGHLVTAMLTKLAGLDLALTFNLMLATIFALCLTMSFSIGAQLFRMSSVLMKENYELGIMNHEKNKHKTMLHNSLFMILSGTLTAFLVTLAGNMQTIYAFTRGYSGDNVAPFWKLLWPAAEFWRQLPEGLERYWYANATRFIPYSIHEFPSYSFVVSDVHGHVLSIPFVLLAIGLLIVFFGHVTHERVNHELRIMNTDWLRLGFYGLLMGILLMTNALDGPIYFGLFLVLFILHNSLFIIQWRKYWKQMVIAITTVLFLTVFSSLPFLIHFKSFVNGIAVDCPPAMLANMKIGPLLFESVDKCQKSPLWMLWLLWGFFWFTGLYWMIARVGGKKIEKNKSLWQSILHVWNTRFTQNERVLIVFFVFSIFLLIFPEFFYFKDIYPMHFRSNTMFKLGYQAFVMFSVVSGYAIINLLANKRAGWMRAVFAILLVPQLFLVSIYPYFSVRSYFGALKTYESLYGLTWISEDSPDDFGAIMWLNRQVRVPQETLVEADGDSYTEYERFSVFTGIPTIVGWSVHEWLWRGTYDVVSPRKEEVRQLYEGNNMAVSREILQKYHVRYLIVGRLEREKYPSLSEEKFAKLGTLVFEQGSTRIYQVGN